MKGKGYQGIGTIKALSLKIQEAISEKKEKQ